MCHLIATLEQESTDALFNHAAKAQSAFADDRVFDGADQKSGDHLTPLARGGDQLRYRGLDDSDG
jgi:hypothetical protein